MLGRTLTLEIVTPQGVTIEEDGIDAVVVRRKEKGPLGSELKILPRHAPLLVRVAPCPLRYYRGSERQRIDIDGGFLEVKNDHVTLVTTGALVNGTI